MHGTVAATATALAQHDSGQMRLQSIVHASAQRQRRTGSTRPDTMTMRSERHNQHTNRRRIR